jgi:molybdate transport system substrate-binding protein
MRMYQRHHIGTRPEGLRGLWSAVLVVLLLFPGFEIAFVSSATAQQPVSITVSAAISLKDALDDLGQKYEKAHPGTTIRFNFGGSGALQHQIEQGAPVDVFFSAAEKQMDDLAAGGLIDSGTRRDIAANNLVLIVPMDSHGVKSFQDLSQPSVKIVAVGEPTSVPAGLYAQQSLDHMGLLAPIKSKLVFAKDVRQVLTYVETGNADAGLVYTTDANISSKVRVAATAPASSHEPILYPAAVLRGSTNMSVARAFLDYTAGREGRAVFEKFGFTSPEK